MTLCQVRTHVVQVIYMQTDSVSLKSRSKSKSLCGKKYSLYNKTYKIIF